VKKVNPKNLTWKDKLKGKLKPKLKKLKKFLGMDDNSKLESPREMY